MGRPPTRRPARTVSAPGASRSERWLAGPTLPLLERIAVRVRAPTGGARPPPQLDRALAPLTRSSAPNQNYQLTRESSLRLIMDYNAVLPNAAFMQTDRAKHIGLDVLFAHILHPGTALYTGYTDGYDNLRLDPSLNPALQRTSSPDLSTGRQVFVKLSYLLRF